MQCSKLCIECRFLSGCSDNGEKRIVGVGFGSADVQDLSTTIQRAQTTALSAHVLPGLSGPPRQTQRLLGARRCHSVSLLSALSPGTCDLKELTLACAVQSRRKA